MLLKMNSVSPYTEDVVRLRKMMTTSPIVIQTALLIVDEGTQ